MFRPLLQSKPRSPRIVTNFRTAWINEASLAMTADIKNQRKSFSRLALDVGGKLGPVYSRQKKMNDEKGMLNV
jgi:hypothetical protein